MKTQAFLITRISINIYVPHDFSNAFLDNNNIGSYNPLLSVHLARKKTNNNMKYEGFFFFITEVFYKSNHNSLSNIPVNPKASEISNLCKEKTNVHLPESQINPSSQNSSPSSSVSL